MGSGRVPNRDPGMPPHLKNLPGQGKAGTSVLQSKDLEALIRCDNSTRKRYRFGGKC